MSPSRPTRRDFLRDSGAALGGALLAAFLPGIEAAWAFAATARREGRPFAVFSPQQAATFEAVADRILPGGADGPGARDAGAAYFADRALDTFFAFQRQGVIDGLARLDARAARLTPTARSFAGLAPDFQDAVLTEMEADPGFFPLRMLTLMGTLGAPEHGGNRDGVGWTLVGFRADGAYRPPFGWYDAEAHGTGEGP